MDKYENYLSLVGRDLLRSIQEPFKIPDKRIGSSYPNTDGDQRKKVDTNHSVRTWDQMSHAERNRYLYG